MSAMELQDIKQAIARFANSVTVVTTAHEGRRYGFMSTAVACIAFDTPAFLITVNRSGSSRDPIDRSRVFAVNLLRDDQREIADRFAGFGGHKGDDRFQGATWTSLTTGAPVLPDVLAAFDCRVTESKEFGSQTLFFGEIVDAASGAESAMPLVYSNRRYVGIT
ncbi:MAG TPA: flavin reductase family protein [Burkholderiales bacterium]|nr:flavin reductase family protein [Burkholderiales bacterium]